MSIRPLTSGFLAVLVFGLVLAKDGFAQPSAGMPIPQPNGMIRLDFQEIDLPVFIRFVSEFTGKNIVIDDKVRGKVSLFSPAKISTDGVYQVFLDVLKLKGFVAVQTGDIIQVLPAADAPATRQIFFHQLKNAEAQELAAVLVGLVTKSAAIPAPQPGKPIVRQPYEFEGQVQIFPDKRSNAIVVTATPADYEALAKIINQLDISPGQVFVEAVILEVSIATLKELGNEPNFLVASQTDDVTSIGGFNRAPEDIVGIASLLAGQLTAGIEDLSPVIVRSFLHALLTRKDVNLLSTPQILTTSHRKARIIVGENRPFVTGQSQSVGGNVLTTIDREDVGVTLELTPQILEDEMIKLEVAQEITAVDETIAQSIGTTPVGPTTTKRGTNTTVIVKDKQPIILGGLIRDNVTLTDRKIPLLGDVPFLGSLFRFETRNSEKVNLLIFLTPHIVRDSSDLKKIGEQKLRDLEPLRGNSRIEEDEILDRTLEHMDDSFRQMSIAPTGEVINHSLSSLRKPSGPLT